MRLLVVGAGSTGGYFGGRLAKAGRDVTFLVRPARAAQLRSEGLRISSPHGDLTLAPKLVTAEEVIAPYDAILLSVKAFSLSAVLQDLGRAVGVETMILSVLNGMKHVDILRERFGATVVVGCVCRISAMLDEKGHIVQLTDLQDLSYGEFDGEPSERLKKVDGFMQGAGFNARLSSTIEREMWEKWVLLASLGAITCLMRGDIGEVSTASGGEGFALRLLEEVTVVARVAGCAPSETFLDTTRAMLTAKNSRLTSSMYRDLKQGRPIEAEQIIGDLLTRACQFNISTPLLAAAYTHLSVYQRRISPGH